jgi:DNA-binding MarR family transcriptional regulator
MSTKWRAGDYVRDQAGAALGARLRRLSDRIDREADALYQALNLDFEQRWFGFVNQLVLHQTRTVGEIAGALGVTHVAVSQVRSALAERGLIVAEIDPADSRKRVLKLSAAGKRLALKLAPIWGALNEAARDLDSEANGVAHALERLESALDRRSLTNRVQSRL